MGFQVILCVNKCCSSLVFHLKPEILGRPSFQLSSDMAQTTYKVKKLGDGGTGRDTAKLSHKPPFISSK
jgi:hypothetical protein